MFEKWFRDLRLKMGNGEISNNSKTTPSSKTTHYKKFSFTRDGIEMTKFSKATICVTTPPPKKWTPKNINRRVNFRAKTAPSPHKKKISSPPPSLVILESESNIVDNFSSSNSSSHSSQHYILSYSVPNSPRENIDVQNNSETLELEQWLDSESLSELKHHLIDNFRFKQINDLLELNDIEFGEVCNGISLGIKCRFRRAIAARELKITAKYLGYSKADSVKSSPEDSSDTFDFTILSNDYNNTTTMSPMVYDDIFQAVDQKKILNDIKTFSNELEEMEIRRQSENNDDRFLYLVQKRQPITLLVE